MNYEQSLEECRRILRDIKFLGFKFTLEPMGDLSDFPYRNVQLVISYTAKDNDHDMGKPTTIVFSKAIPLIDIKSRFVEFVFNAVEHVLRHEAGELFYVRGERPFNEHNNEPSYAILSRMFPLDEHWNHERGKLHSNTTHTNHA